MCVCIGIARMCDYIDDVCLNLPLCLTREVAQIDQFLQETAAREANAKVRLQQFIEELLDRADRAEKQLQIISSCGTTPNGSLGRCSLQGSKGNGRQVRKGRSSTTKRFLLLWVLFVFGLGVFALSWSSRHMGSCEVSEHNQEPQPG